MPDPEATATLPAPADPPAAANLNCAACRSVVSAHGRNVIEKSAHLAKLEGAEAALEEKKRELASLSAKVRELEQQIEAEAEPVDVPQPDGNSRDYALEF